MSDTSECEEFYDAEDVTPGRTLRKRNSIPTPTTEEIKGKNFEIPQPPPEPAIKSHDGFKVPFPPDQSTSDTGKVGISSQKIEVDLGQSRKRFRELRYQMVTDDDDVVVGGSNPSPPDSQTSSVEGLYPNPPSKSSHPFRIIEHDGASVHSLTSLGRVGRILSGSDNAAAVKDAVVVPSGSCSSIAEDTVMDRAPSPASTASSRSASAAPTPTVPPPKPLPFLEPDVIVSAKNSKSSDPSSPVPVAPPRKKKKGKSTPAEEQRELVLPLPSPASTIESLTRELEHSLDIQAVTKGKYVVKPQDDEAAKAEGPPPPPSPPSQGTLSVVPEPNRIPAPSHCTPKERIILFPAPHTSNSIGRASINSSTGLSMSHFTGLGLGSTHSGNHEGSSRLRISPRGSKERRRSAGDEQAMTQLNMFVRTRTDSGKQLSDLEILEQVTVLNLDTGERVPLSVAEDKLPQGINPLSLHIMRLTSEYVSNPVIPEKESDDESVDSKMTESVVGGLEHQRQQLRRRTDRFRKFLGTTVKKTVDKAKSIAHEVSHGRHKEDMMDMGEEGPSGETYVKLKVSNSHKGPYDFDSLQMVQDLSGQHQGPIWCMKFSACGRLLATAGQDRVLRLWVLRSAYQHFRDMRTKYNAEKVSPTPSQESLVSQQSAEEQPFDIDGASVGPFMPRPFCTYIGHTSDLLDLAWSKSYFVLSSSMDKTVRLWHISRKECLCCFQHIDFVTAIVFHPKDDRYFLSGSLDGKLRLWNIPDKKVAVWNELDGRSPLITAANFCQNGKFAVVGTYDGRCVFYNTDQLKYHTSIEVRSSRGKNATGRKICGVEPMPGEDKILVTSNDSRIRLYDLRDLSLTCKYKGYVNVSSQIKASFSHDGKYIVSGSENQCLYLWKTNHEYFKFSSVRRDRNDYWEGVKAHNAVVTSAVFAPHPDILMQEEALGTPPPSGYALVSADFNGCIKVFVNKMKPKHSSLPASALA